VTTHPSEAWQRLGAMLIRRRIELDPRYHNRTLFAVERGVDARVVFDIEKHRRGNFELKTIMGLERAYGLRPGSVGTALAGGELTAAPQPAPPAIAPESAATAPAPGADFVNWADPIERAIWDLPASENERRTLIVVHRGMSTEAGVTAHDAMVKRAQRRQA